MKRFLLFILGLIFGMSFTKAQDNNSKDVYYPLVQENVIWSTSDILSSGDISNLRFYPKKITFFGDTIFDGIAYKKIYISTLEFPEFPQDWTLRSFIREDENKRIWHKENSNSAEELYYDFSLNIGDAVPEGIGYATSPVVVEDIVFQTMSNGEERKVFKLSGYCSGFPNTYEFWIEGIGSILGVLAPLTGELVGSYSRLLCFHKNEELVFFNDNAWGNCYMNSIGINTFDYQINIYPSPAKNMLYLENLDNLDIKRISLINSKGQIVRQYEQAKDRISISDIPAGMYFIKFTSSKENIIKKIIIEK